MSLFNRVLDAWYSLPQAARSAIVDAVESGAAAALAVQVAFPSDASGLFRLATTLGTAFAAAFISNLRRRAQDALASRLY